MDIGFETIGNATLICHDRVPVLATDPWIEGGAYFGSWRRSHAIPERQMQAIRDCRYLWISHGHPDHLSLESLEQLRGKPILLPDHVGHRVHDDLAREGFEVRILPDRRWTQLSDRIRVFCIADYNQDGVLLVDVGGVLVLDLNDASDHGWGREVKRQARGFDRRFLLALSGGGDADMINVFDEDGARVLPPGIADVPAGAALSRRADLLGARYCVPFSSMHVYAREDSAWANRYAAKVTDHAQGFDSETCEILPAFVRYDCERDSVEEIEPPAEPLHIVDPRTLGDDWSEPLARDELEELARYFRQFEHLSGHLDFINVRVGGEDHLLDVAGRRAGRGLTLEAPRGSLMTAVRWSVFDDLMIGNFMKVTLHGDWDTSGRPLYPDFTPYVAKYGDNGGARTADELRAYFREYRRRAGFDYFRYRFEAQAIDRFRSFTGTDSRAWRAARRLYWMLKSA